MLIASPRHTQRDREAWVALEEMDRVNAQRWRAKLAEKAARAAEDAATFIALGPCYAGISWGKDSCVLAHVLHSHGVRVPWVWVRLEGVENPDCPLVRDAFLARFHLDYHEVSAPLGERRRTERGFALAAERFGDRHVSGVRGEEAGYRMIRMRRWGVSTERTCAPLGWWSTAEIYAYLHAHDVPTHPAYACTLGGLLEREHLRVSSIGGERGREMGRAEWERRYYPEVVTGNRESQQRDARGDSRCAK